MDIENVVLTPESERATSVVNEPVSSVVTRQRARLTQLLYAPMQRIGILASRLARDGSLDRSFRSDLDILVGESLATLPFAKYLYVLNRNGIQISSSMSREGLITEHYGRDRSERPYMKEALSIASALDLHRETCYQQWPYLDDGTQAVDFLLCDAYISANALRPSMTATYFLRDRQGSIAGFLGADFALRELPPIEGIYRDTRRTRTFSLDPLPDQIRSASRLDREMDTVISVLEELMMCRGVYHVKLHFSSSQTVVWQLDDPYRYHIFSVSDLLDADSCLAYPNRSYPEEAIIPEDQIRTILDRLKALRNSKSPVYLRSCSINIFNGMVGLSFSSEGSSYMPYENFLKTDPPM
ncbi:hypothetical protein BAE30_08215 [Acidithiobacillus caldus]|uniref:Uncharacterized protein n=1 Tax=Acidithiobacillus caldus TaxID=33059 RepID=A0A1E7YVP7_9PROT|nr:hypothetical protein BAE30_08215 [Acidithiobacillus caldus]